MLAWADLGSGLPALASWGCPLKDYHRFVGEHFPIGRSVLIPSAALAELGYESDALAAATLAAATVQLVVPHAASPITLPLDVACTEEAGIGVRWLLTCQPPVELTDTALSHDYYVVVAPDSAVAAQRLWRGNWLVEAAPEAH